MVIPASRCMASRPGARPSTSWWLGPGIAPGNSSSSRWSSTWQSCHHGARGTTPLTSQRHERGPFIHSFIHTHAHTAAAAAAASEQATLSVWMDRFSMPRRHDTSDPKGESSACGGLSPAPRAQESNGTKLLINYYYCYYIGVTTRCPPNGPYSKRCQIIALARCIIASATLFLPPHFV